MQYPAIRYQGQQPQDLSPDQMPPDLSIQQPGAEAPGQPTPPALENSSLPESSPQLQPQATSLPDQNQLPQPLPQPQAQQPQPEQPKGSPRLPAEWKSNPLLILSQGPLNPDELMSSEEFLNNPDNSTPLEWKQVMLNSLEDKQGILTPAWWKGTPQQVQGRIQTFHGRTL